VVLSIDYRRPLKVRFPGAFDDALAATRWASRNIKMLGGDARLLAVAGDSAGGQLVASLALGILTYSAERRSGPEKHSCSRIPRDGRRGRVQVTSPVENAKYPSRAQDAEGYFLTTDAMRFFAGQYLSAESDGR